MQGNHPKTEYSMGELPKPKGVELQGTQRVPDSLQAPFMSAVRLSFGEALEPHVEAKDDPYT